MLCSSHLSLCPPPFRHHHEKAPGGQPNAKAIVRDRAAATRTSRTSQITPKLSGKGWVCAYNHTDRLPTGRTAGSGLRAPNPPAGVQPRLCPCVSLAGSSAGPLFNILSTLRSTPCLTERERRRWTKDKALISLRCSQAKQPSDVHFSSPLESAPAPRVASVCPVTCCTTFCLGLWGKSLPASLLHTTAPSGVYPLKHSVLVSFLKDAGSQSPSPQRRSGEIFPSGTSGCGQGEAAAGAGWEQGEPLSLCLRISLGTFYSGVNY